MMSHRKNQKKVKKEDNTLKDVFLYDKIKEELEKKEVDLKKEKKEEGMVTQQNTAPSFSDLLKWD